MASPVPDNISDFISLYASQFAELRFPELDLAVLEQSLRGVELAQSRVSEAEAALETARGDLNESMTELSHKAYRALCFLKLYAQDDEEALARLDAVVLARPTRRLGKPRRRGREPSEGSVEVESLAQLSLGVAQALG